MRKIYLKEFVLSGSQRETIRIQGYFFRVPKRMQQGEGERKGYEEEEEQEGEKSNTAIQHLLATNTKNYAKP